MPAPPGGRGGARRKRARRIFARYATITGALARASIEIMAVSDAHSPRYLPLLISSIKSLLGYRPDLILFAGDMIDKGDVGSMKPLRDFIASRFPGTPVVSVFGNEEYLEKIELLRKSYADIAWLDDQSWASTINGARVCVYGTRGSLERLTSWQRRNMPHLAEVFEKRLTTARQHLSELRRSCEILILLMHYSPTTRTLKGEPVATYPYLCHRGFEAVISETRPDLVVHGHAHASTAHFAEISGVPVFNVALPAVGGVTKVRAEVEGGKARVVRL